MSIKPPIKCPPDYSVLVFRMTECKKLGIVKGITTQLAVDMQDLYIPITNYEERVITLKAGDTKRLDVSSIGETGKIKEQFVFTANPDYCGLGTDHSYSLYDEQLNLIETLNFSVNDDYPTWYLAFTAAYQASSQINLLIGFEYEHFQTDGTITSTDLTDGVKHRHVFSFDITGFGGYPTYPYLHPGNLKTPNEKYPLGAVKLIMLYPDYYKASINTNCGCIDPSGDMKSNVKYFEFAYDNEVNQINNPGSPIIYDPRTNKWSQDSTDHIGYYFNVGDLVIASGDNKVRGIITSIEGYDITLDINYVGDYTQSDLQTLSHVNSPNYITWRKIGDFFIQSTAQDVDSTDRDYIETLWLNNPHKYDLPIKIVLAS